MKQSNCILSNESLHGNLEKGNKSLSVKFSYQVLTLSAENLHESQSRFIWQHRCKVNHVYNDDLGVHSLGTLGKPRRQWQQERDETYFNGQNNSSTHAF